MIVYLNADGTIQQVVPQNLTQGSNNQNLIVIGANLSNYTTLTAIFKLPNKQVLAPRLMTKQDSDYVINNEIVNAWVCKIDKPITNFSGTLEITIDATDVNGVKVNSYFGAVQIAPTNAPTFPQIDESAEDVFNRIKEAYAVISGRLLEKQDIYDDTLQTAEKTVVGAINELNDKEMQSSGDIAELRTDVDELKLDVNEVKLDIQNNTQDINELQGEVVGIKNNYALKSYVDDLYAQLSIGGNKSLVFDTKQQFLDWLDGTYQRTDGITPTNLNLGDIILFKEQGVPDYWVSSISSPMTINDFTEYEVKIDIEDYATLEQLNALDVRVEVVEENLTQITPDVARALKTPMSAPATTKLVAVDTTNSQEMITIGENLTLSNGILSATGGSSGTMDYSDLTNKPQINNVTLTGNKSLADLGIDLPTVTRLPSGV